MTDKEINDVVTRLIYPNLSTWQRMEHIPTPTIGLRRDTEFRWVLEPIVGKCDKSRKYTTIIELPTWLWGEPDNYKFGFGVAIYITSKLTLASRAIKSASHRSKATKQAIGKAGAQARWHSH